MIAGSAGTGNIIVQIAGDQNTVSLCQRPGITLLPLRADPPKNEIEILHAHRRAVPFVGRRSDLDRLWNWICSDAQVSVVCITGAGGSGKTRLAHELIHRVADDAPAVWQAGFAHFNEPNLLANAPTVATSSKPLLAVIDYAASQAEDLRKALQDVAQYGCALPRLRLLLLERSADPNHGW